MKRSITLIGFLFFLVCPLSAQEPRATPSPTPEKPPLPPPPILHRAPDPGQWTIEYDAAPAAKGNPSSSPSPSEVEPGKSREKKPTPHKITVTKAGKTYLEIEIDAEGKQWEKWNVKGKQVTFVPGTDKWILTEGGLESVFFTNYTQHDFPDFNWISAKNYVAFGKVFNADCFIFRDQIMLPEGLVPVDVTAAIDSHTQLPVYLDQGGVKRTYKFDPPPQTPPSVPARVQTILTQQEKAVSPLLRRPGQP